MRNLPSNRPRSLIEPAVRGEGDNRLRSYYVDAAAGGALNDREADSFSQYWRIVSRRKGALLMATMLGGLAAFLLTLPQTPVYRAQTFLEIQNLNDDFLNMRNVSPTASASAYQSPEYNIRTQTTILQSRPVLELAIHNLSIEEKARLLQGEPKEDRFQWRKIAGI